MRFRNLCGFATASLCCASTAVEAALPVPLTQEQSAEDPYRQHGLLVRGSNGLLTGFVVHDPRIIVSAAHGFVRDDGTLSAISAYYWVHRYHGVSIPTQSLPAVSIRAYSIYTGSGGYAAKVVQHGINSQEAFEQDVAVVTGYSDFIEESVLPFPDNAPSLLTSIRPKTGVGYPASLYGNSGSNPTHFWMHATLQDVLALDRLSAGSNLFEVPASVPHANTNLIAAPGMSGGALMVMDATGVWIPAGTIVAGKADIALPSSTPQIPQYAGRLTARQLSRDDFDLLIAPMLGAMTGDPPSGSITADPVLNGLGDPVHLTARVGGWRPFTLQWLFNGADIPGATSSSFDIAESTAANEGNYTVRMSNRWGTAETQPYQLDLQRQPVIEQQPQFPSSHAIGEEVFFEIQAVGARPLEVEWFLDGIPFRVPADASGSLRFTAQASDYGTFTARLSNAYGEIWTQPLPHQVVWRDDLVGQYDLRQSGFPGMELTINLANRKQHILSTFQWYKDGVAIANAQGPDLALPPNPLGHQGSYHVEIVRSDGVRVVSAPISIVDLDWPSASHPPAEKLTWKQWAGVATIGERVILELDFQGRPQIDGFQWFKDEVLLEGVTGSRYVIDPVTASSFGEYRVTTTNPPGSRSTFARLTQIDPRPLRQMDLPGTALPPIFVNDRWITLTQDRRAATAPDGLNWTFDPFPAPADGYLRSTGTRAVFVQQNNPWTSEDGTTWTRHAAAISSFNSIVRFGDRVLIVDYRTSAVSDNGIFWTASSSNVLEGKLQTQLRQNLAASDHVAVALLRDDVVAWSNDGLQWTSATPPTPPSGESWRAVVSANGWIVLSNLGSHLARSADGRAWELIDLGELHLAQVYGADGYFAAVSSNGRELVLISRDAITWEAALHTGEEVEIYSHGDDRLVLRPLSSARDRRMLLSPQLTNPLRFVESPRSQFSMPGGELTLRAQPGNAADVAYQWYEGPVGDTSRPIAGATTDRLSITAGSQPTQYWVRASDGESHNDSEAAEISVLRPGVYLPKSWHHSAALRIDADGSAYLIGSAAIGGVFEAGDIRNLDSVVPANVLESGLELPVTITTTAGSLIVSTEDLNYFREPIAFSTQPAAEPSPYAGHYRFGVTGRDALSFDLLVDENRAARGAQRPGWYSSVSFTGVDESGHVVSFAPYGRLTIAIEAATGVVSGTYQAPNSSKLEPVHGLRQGTEDGTRVVNLSGRGTIKSPDDRVIAGFVVGGDDSQEILIRGVGPGLAPFLGGSLNDPTLEAFRDGELVDLNHVWEEHPQIDRIRSLSATVGAFDLAAASEDAVLLLDVPPGAMTAHISGANGTTGTTLGEIYLNASESGGSLANISVRSRIGGNARRDIIAGFVIEGDRACPVLLRGVGAGLRAFGVTDAIANANAALYSGETLLISRNSWTDPVENAATPAMIQAVGRAIGAFDLDQESSDAAILAWLQPGVYTLVVTSNDDSEGMALAEIYRVPFEAMQ